VFDGIKGAGHRIQLAISERTVIVERGDVRNVIALAHDLLHQASADHPSLVRPHCRNSLSAPVKRFTARAGIGHFVMVITAAGADRRVLPAASGGAKGLAM
jgi:hypothetical protein